MKATEIPAGLKKYCDFLEQNTINNVPIYRAMLAHFPTMPDVFGNMHDLTTSVCIQILYLEKPVHAMSSAMLNTMLPVAVLAPIVTNKALRTIDGTFSNKTPIAIILKDTNNESESRHNEVLAIIDLEKQQSYTINKNYEWILFDKNAALITLFVNNVGILSSVIGDTSQSEARLEAFGLKTSHAFCYARDIKDDTVEEHDDARITVELYGTVDRVPTSQPMIHCQIIAGEYTETSSCYTLTRIRGISDYNSLLPQSRKIKQKDYIAKVVISDYNRLPEELRENTH